MALSDQGHYRSRLSEAAGFIHRQIGALQNDGGEFPFDRSIIPLVLRNLKDPSFRDILSLRRAAKNGLMAKELNMHEIGPDGYASHVLRRKRDIGAAEFDAIRGIGDGDLYVVVVYENGVRTQNAVPKDRWYAALDMMTIADRKMVERPRMQKFYEEVCENLIERYLTTGTIAG